MKKIHHRLLPIITVFFLTTLFPCPGNGEEIVFCTPNKKGQIIFQVSEVILTEAFHRLGHDFRLKTYPAKRCPVMVDTGTVDGDSHRIFSFNENNRYPNLIRVEAVIQTIDQSVFTKKENLTVSGWESLKPYNIIYMAGIKVIEDGLDKAHIPAENRKSVYTHERAIHMLAAGQGDVFIVSAATGNYILDKTGLRDSGIRLVSPPLVSIDLYPYMHKKRRGLAEKLAAAMHAMQADGTCRRIISTLGMP